MEWAPPVLSRDMAEAVVSQPPVHISAAAQAIAAVQVQIPPAVLW